MDKYEVLYIIRCDVDDDLKTKTVEKFASVVESLGGTVDSVDKWGLKKFAYPIEKKNEGYYVLMNFTATSDAQIELDRLLSIDEAVVRQMIIKK